MRALVLFSLHYRHQNAQNAPLRVVLLNLQAISGVQAVMQDLLIAYPVINICDWIKD